MINIWEVNETNKMIEQENLDVPTFTELHTRSVSASACGMERIRCSSPAVIPLDTSAEYPPISK